MPRVPAANEPSPAILRELVESAPDALLVVGPDGHIVMRGILAGIQDVVWSLSLADWKILYMSPAGERMFGRPVAEFYENGQLWLDAVHPEDRARMAAVQQEMIQSGTGEAEFRILRSDGDVRHIQTRAWCSYADGKPFRLEGINTDVTERRKAEQDLERERLALEEAQALAHVGSWEWDPVADRVSFSKEGWKIWGEPPGSTTSSRHLLRMVHPDDLPGFEAALARAVTEGTEYEYTVRITTSQGKLHTRHRGRVAARDANGKPSRLLGTIEDVTERVAAEARRLKLDEIQREAQRLAELNAFKTQFMNMVAHDLNNVLTPLALNLKLARMGAAKPGGDAIRAIDNLEANLRRLSGFLADLLDASRLQSGRLIIDPKPFDLAVVVQETLDSVKAAADEAGVRLTLATRPSLQVKVDRRRLEQVITNLLSNALKFTPKGGDVSVRLEAPEGVARIAVADTGRGLSPDEVGKLFQPFTKLAGAQGKHTGTGLGLFICRGIVEAHGGRITCHSAGPGKGCTFVVEIPLQAPAAAA